MHTNTKLSRVEIQQEIARHALTASNLRSFIRNNVLNLSLAQIQEYRHRLAVCELEVAKLKLQRVELDNKVVEHEQI